MALKLLSFDVWDTLIIDDSDELYRKKNGLPSKSEEREDLYLNAYCSPNISPELVREAMSFMQESFTHQWKNKFKTPGVRWRLNELEKFLGRSQKKPFVLDEEVKKMLISSLEEMELKYPIKPMPGAKEFLMQWRSTYPEIKVGIISDAIYSPGRCIRKILENVELVEYFDYFSFSDEVGASKPSSKIFSYLMNQASVMPNEIVHIGDRIANDIVGAEEFGAVGVLCQVHQQNQEKSMEMKAFDQYVQLNSILGELI